MQMLGKTMTCPDCKGSNIAEQSREGRWAKRIVLVCLDCSRLFSVWVDWQGR